MVVDNSNAPVSDATVKTTPATQSLMTDALGSVFFAKVPVGGYTITAIHPTKGSGGIAQQVRAGAVSNATVMLNGIAGTGGAGTGGTGGVGGTGGQVGGTGGQIGGTGGVGGTGGQVGGTGGQIGGTGGQAGTSGGAGAGGKAGAGGVTGTGGAAGAAGTQGTGGTAGAGTGGTGGLAGSSGLGGAAGSTAKVVLAALTKDTNAVTLNWTATPSDGFATYRIYRNSLVVNILQDGTSVTYRDDSVQLGVTYTYQVGGVTAGGVEVRSNTQMIETGVYIDVASQIQKLMVDPTRPYLYGIDKVNNSLHFINVNTGTVDKTIYVGSSPVDCDINLEGTTLYVANFGSTEIAMVDLASQTLAGTILVNTSAGTWSGNPYKVACTAGDTLVFTSMDQWNDVTLVNALTGATMSVTGSIYEPDLVASPDGNSVYAGESGISTETLYRFDLVSGALTQTDTSAGLPGFTSSTTLMSKNGLYVFYSGMKFLAKNLKSVLGTFSEAIYAINSDGSLAIGANHVFNGTTFAVTRTTPISTSTMAVSPDDKTLYLYDTATSRIYIYGLN